MKRPCTYLSLVLILLLGQSRVVAWNDVPHMIIAQIAISRLNPDVATPKVNELARRLKFGQMHYVPALTMPGHMDDVRTDPYYDSLRPWHYVDISFFDGIPPRAGGEGEKASQSPKVNMVTQIPYVVNRLRVLAAATAPLSEAEAMEEAQLLAFLMHMVGDVHQPLHCATRYSASRPDGDAGGNAYALQGQYHNLHALWDSAAGQFPGDLSRPFNDKGLKETEIRNYAFDLVGSLSTEGVRWQDDSDVTKWAQVSDKLASAWAHESHQIAVSYAYRTPERAEPSEAYMQELRKITRMQMMKAGFRLAALLNSIYPQPPPPPTPQQQQQQRPAQQQQQQQQRPQQQQQQQQQPPQGS